MRIDFDSSYHQIRSLLEASAEPKIAPVASPGEFLETLESIHPKVKESSKKEAFIAKKDGNLPLLTEQPRASLNLNQIELIPPASLVKTATLQAPFNTDKVGTIDGSGVKNSPLSAPTILEAKRVPSSKEFDKLPPQARKDTVQDLVAKAGLDHGIDPALSMAVVEAESSFNNKAVSSDGFESKGLMQLLDSTGKQTLERLGEEGSDYEPFEPWSNINLGVGHLRHLHDVFSEATPLAGNLTSTPAANSASLEKLAVASYNAGEGRVAGAQGRAEKAGKNPGIYEEVASYLPEITQQYVNRVFSLRAQLATRFLG